MRLLSIILLILILLIVECLDAGESVFQFLGRFYNRIEQNRMLSAI